MNAKRLVVRFSSGGLLRFLSHQETVTAIERIIRRSMIPVSYTQGFHPRIKIKYAPAVPTGVASMANYVMLDCEEPISDALNRLNERSVFTLRALRAWFIPTDYKKVEDFLDSYRFSLFLPSASYDPGRFDGEATVTKKTKSGQRSFRAGDVFANLTVTTLRTCHMVEYFQPTDSLVSSEELMRIMAKNGAASYEGVFVLVREGYFENRETSVILDEIGGIQDVRSQQMGEY